MVALGFGSVIATAVIGAMPVVPVLLPALPLLLFFAFWPCVANEKAPEVSLPGPSPVSGLALSAGSDAGPVGITRRKRSGGWRSRNRPRSRPWLPTWDN